MKSVTKKWLQVAGDDYDAAIYLYKGARYPQAIYFICQSIEKLLKAIIVETTDSIPEKSHRLENLAKRIKTITFSEEQLVTLTNLSIHYSQVRYPDIAQMKFNTKRRTEPILEKGKTIYLWLQKKFKMQ